MLETSNDIDGGGDIILSVTVTAAYTSGNTVQGVEPQKQSYRMAWARVFTKVNVQIIDYI